MCCCTGPVGFHLDHVLRFHLVDHDGDMRGRPEPGGGERAVAQADAFGHLPEVLTIDLQNHAWANGARVVSLDSRRQPFANQCRNPLRSAARTPDAIQLLLGLPGVSVCK
jgi:hypothetical protein